MKGLILILLAYCALTSATKPCCENDELIGYRKCENNARIQLNCTNGWMLLKDIVLKGDRLFTKDAENFEFSSNSEEYCTGKMYKNSSAPEEGLMKVAVLCFQSTPVEDYTMRGYLVLTSVVFLVITAAVYVYLPKLWDLPGRCYVSLCISMAIGFLSLALIQISYLTRGSLCTSTGFVIYFWLMATFFWMNVICINVYRSVIDIEHLKKTESTQYFYYSCYAWGSSLAFLIIAVVTNSVEGSHYKPGIGESSCWISGRTETWIFFYGPIAVLIIVNICLFFLSSAHLWRQTRKYETSIANNLKFRFLLSLKLFLVMGVTWIFEVASFAHGENYILWDIMDVVNCLQGIINFVLLVVLRKRAILGFVEKGICVRLLRPLAEMLSPHDEEDQLALEEEQSEVRLN